MNGAQNRRDLAANAEDLFPVARPAKGDSAPSPWDATPGRDLLVTPGHLSSSHRAGGAVESDGRELQAAAHDLWSEVPHDRDISESNVPNNARTSHPGAPEPSLAANDSPAPMPTASRMRLVLVAVVLIAAFAVAVLALGPAAALPAAPAIPLLLTVLVLKMKGRR